MVQTKADLDLKNMLLKTDREIIRLSAYPNPMAGLMAEKIKGFALKFYQLEPSKCLLKRWKMR